MFWPVLARVSVSWSVSVVVSVLVSAGGLVVARDTGSVMLPSTVWSRS